MPVKKKTGTTTTVKTEKAEKAPEKKPAVKKAAAKKPVAEKKAEPEVKKAEAVKAEPEVKKAPARKTAAKKAPAKKAAAPAEKKPAEKKAAVKKPAAKKAPAKKAAAVKEEKKPETPKKTFQTYKDVINWKKWEAHNMNWLYIEVNAGDLLDELERGTDNIETCASAVLDCMLEGDGFINDPENRISRDLTVRYYCDNLSEDRRKWSDVN